MGMKYLLTFKSTGVVSRDEVEIEMTPEDFQKLWPMTKNRRIRKYRHKKVIRGHTVELDIYKDALQGLYIAEIEFPSEVASVKFTPFEWLTKEVTFNPNFKNRNLIGFKSLSALLKLL